MEDAINYYEENDPKGECVLVIEGRSREERRQEEVAKWEEMSIEEHMEYYLNQGIAKKEAMKRGATALYVSASPTQETIDFYTTMGYKVNTNPIESYANDEPRDIHMECEF